MKTIYLFLISIFLILSFNGFSQKKVTIRQEIPQISEFVNNQKEISCVDISSKYPIIIRKGLKNIIYLTGNIKDSSDYAGLCYIKNACLFINNVGNPSTMSEKDYSIIVELVDTLINFNFHDNTNVKLTGDYNIGNERCCSIFAEYGSNIIFDGNFKSSNLSIKAVGNSSIIFNSIDSKKAYIEVLDSSKVSTNGVFDSLYIYNTKSIVTGNYSAKVVFNDSIVRNPFIDDKSYSLKNEEDDISPSNYKVNQAVSQSFNDRVSSLYIGKNNNVTFRRSDIGVTVNLESNCDLDLSNFVFVTKLFTKVSIPDNIPFPITIYFDDKSLDIIYISDGNNIIFKDEVANKSHYITIGSNSSIIYEKPIISKKVDFTLRNKCNIIIDSISANKITFEGEDSCFVSLNGEIGEFVTYKYDNINFSGHYRAKSTSQKTYKTLAIDSPPQTLFYQMKNVNNRLNVKKDTLKIQDERALSRYIGKDKVSLSPYVSVGTTRFAERPFEIRDAGGIYSFNQRKLFRSWSFGMVRYHIIKPKLVFGYGLGFESDIFTFKENVKLDVVNGDKKIVLETNPSINAESRLVARYITLPVSIKYYFYRGYSFNIGLVGGINYNSKSTGFKRSYDLGQAEIEERWGENYSNFNRWKLDSKIALGIGAFNVYLQASLLPIFKENRENKVYSVSSGIALGF